MDFPKIPNMPNTLLVCQFDCTEDTCREPTKRFIGSAHAYDILKPHVNHYCCDNKDCSKKQH